MDKNCRMTVYFLLIYAPEHIFEYQLNLYTGIGLTFIVSRLR